MDRATREVLPNVTVAVLGTTRGTSSDPEGTFRIDNLPAGAYALQARLVGYEPVILTDVPVSPGRISRVDITLREQTIETEGLTVTGGYFPGAGAVERLDVSFNAAEIRRSPGSANDVSRILMALPSTAKIADNGNDLAVRGGSPIENGFYVDGIPVPNINHFPVQGSTGGPIGILNIDFIDRVDFLMSGFSASYGDRLSSVVDIDYREGSAEALYGKAFLSFAGVGATAESPLPDGAGSWMFSASKSYLDLIVGAIGTGVAPNYWDAQGKVSLRLNDRHSLNILGIGGWSRIDFDRETSIDEGDRFYGSNHNSQGTLGLRWNAVWGTGYYSTTGLSLSSAGYESRFTKGSSGLPALNSMNRDLGLTLRSLHYLQLGKAARLEAGADIRSELGVFDTFFGSDTTELGTVDPDRSVDRTIRSLKSAVFATLYWDLTDRWVVSAGVRGDHFAFGRNLTVSPRIGISFRASGDLTLHLRGGLFTQQVPLIVLAGRPAFEDLPVMKAVHAGVGADFMLTPETKLTVEAYVKEYRDLPLDAADPAASVVDDGVFNRRFMVYDDLRGSGRAYTRGIEFMLQRKISGGIYGVVSGSYARSRYRDLAGAWQNRAYDNRWIFSLIGGYKPDQEWEYSIRWTAAGGGPYTPFDPRASAAANIGILDRSRTNAERFPSYHSLNLRVDRKFYFAGHTLDIYLSVWNAYNRKNVAGYYWNATENREDVRYQWSVLPVVGVEYEF